MPFSVRFRYNWSNLFNPLANESRMTLWAGILNTGFIFGLVWVCLHFCLITFPTKILIHPAFFPHIYPYLVLLVSLPFQLNLYMAWLRRMRQIGWKWPLWILGTLVYLVCVNNWWHGRHVMLMLLILVCWLLVAFRKDWRTKSTKRLVLFFLQGYGQSPDELPKRFKGRDLAFSHPERMRRRDNPEDYDDDDE